MYAVTSAALPMNKYLFLFFVLLFGIYTACWSQESMMRFEHLSIADGLSQSSALCMLQDKKGFLWIGTSDGLNRYDGYGIKVYRRSFRTNESLGNNYINGMVEDDKGNIWIATRNGLCKYNVTTDNFTNYLRDSVRTVENHFVAIAIDEEGNLWCGNVLLGLFKFSPKTQTFETIKPKNTQLKIGMINALCYDKTQKSIWVGTEFGLVNYHIANQQFTPYFNQATINLPDNKVSSLYIDNHNNLWVGLYSGHLLRWNINQEQHLVKTIELPHNADQAYGANRVRTVLEANNGDIWVGCASTGLFKLQPLVNNYHITSIQHDVLDNYSLSDNDVYSLLEDKNGLLWVGTYGGGVNKLNYQQAIFNYYRHEAGNRNSLLQNGIRAIMEDTQGNLWVGTVSQGISRFNRQDQSYEHFSYQKNNPHSLGSNRINAILQDHKGVIWVGTGGGGLNKIVYDTVQGKVSSRVERVEIMNPLQKGRYGKLDTYVYVLKEDKQHRLWIGSNNGLWILDKQRRLAQVCYPDKDNPFSISDHQVRTISFDDNGNVWIGTFHGGLNKLDTKTRKFTHYKNSINCKNCISDNAISSIYIDTYGALWIGTFGGGLNRFDLKTEQFEHITEEQGIANDVVYGILEDKFNNLWLSTNRGLTRYNVLTKLIVNYNITDGLQSDEFNANAYYEGQTGTFYFGGINGLTSFRPEFMQDTTSRYPLYITDFRLFNQSVKPSTESVLRTNTVETQAITLSYHDYVFAFEFAALNFRTPHRLRYAYKLENFDEDWIYVSSKERLATYSNIPAGQYTFRVKVTNNNGAWEENKGLAVKLIVRPPFWATWWFRLSLLVLFAIVLVYVYQYRTRKLREQKVNLEKLVTQRTQELLAKTVETEENMNIIVKQYEQLSDIFEKLKTSEKELAELNASKNKFFSILAHDLRSPLNSLGGFSSLLVNFADELSKEEIKSLAQELDKNIKTSTKYLENLLTWARSQMNSIDFVPTQLSLLESVLTSVNLLEAHAHAKHLQLQMDIPKHLEVYADHNQLQTILTNLINNAIKFTEENGSITIKASLETEMVLTAVTDTGVGMSKEVADKIFRIDAKHSTTGTAGEKGTGLGLLLCKEFVEKNGGRIWVDSTEGQGTTFYFTLLATNSKQLAVNS